MIAVARIMGALYIVLGCLAAVVFAINMAQAPTGSARADSSFTLMVASLGIIAVGGLIGAVGEIGSLVRKIANRRPEIAAAVATVAAPSSPPEWVVVGRDNKGHERHVRVRAASKEDAFMAATIQGVTQAVSIERA